MKNNTLIVAGGGIILLVAVLFYVTSAPKGPSQLDSFAQCLTAKGAKFYGAFWCPHCAAQKKIFGSSIKFVDYVECSTPDGDNQNQVCKDAHVESYPTWIFADGSVSKGEQSLDALSTKTGCALPVAAK
jgi:hypothetical protein